MLKPFLFFGCLFHKLVSSLFYFRVPYIFSDFFEPPNSPVSKNHTLSGLDFDKEKPLTYQGVRRALGGHLLDYKKLGEKRP